MGIDSALEFDDAMPGEFAAICALNLANEQHTSPMDLPRLATLHSLACRHRVVRLRGRVVAFLLAMRDGTAYANDNFAWFAQRLPAFVYVDRVVVAADVRGLRVAAQLYAELFTWARERGIPHIACEYNLVPPNEASRAFHDRQGFAERGRQWVAGGAKCVSLQVRDV